MNMRIGVMAMLFALPLAATAQETGSSSRGAASGIEIGDLIARFAKRTGKQFIIDPRVRAQVELAGMDADHITWEKLLAILNVYNFAAVTQGDWIVAVPDANARQLPTPVYTDRNFKAAPDEIVTLVLPVKKICAPMLVPVLRPLMPQAAHMAAYPQINTLVLSDHAANVRRVANIIDELERNAPNGAGCRDQEAEKK